MTVITIVLIGIVLGVGTILVNNLLKNTEDSSDCTAKGNIWYNGACYPPSSCTTAADGKTTCS